MPAFNISVNQSCCRGHDSSWAGDELALGHEKANHYDFAGERSSTFDGIERLGPTAAVDI